MPTGKPSVKCECLNCGASFLVYPYQVRGGGGKFCSNKCYHDSMRNTIECECDNCGKMFQTYPSSIKNGRKYCSQECAGNARLTSVMVNCPQCGKEFRVTTNRLNRGEGKYCSRKCVQMSQKVDKIKRVCLHCGKEFEVFPYVIKDGHGDYCSKKCWYASRPLIECTCLVCGKKFKRTQNAIDNGGGKFCSQEHHYLYHTGEGSPNWRGGKVRSWGLNWKPQRRLAYARDQGICQHCGITEDQALKKYRRRCAVHHIVKRRVFRDRGEPVENANALSNLITLCIACHPKAEHGKITLQPKLF
jgi:hypothetical protein